MHKFKKNKTYMNFENNHNINVFYKFSFKKLDYKNK